MYTLLDPEIPVIGIDPCKIIIKNEEKKEKRIMNTCKNLATRILLQHCLQKLET